MRGEQKRRGRGGRSGRGGRPPQRREGARRKTSDYPSFPIPTAPVTVPSLIAPAQLDQVLASLMEREARIAACVAAGDDQSTLRYPADLAAGAASLQLVANQLGADLPGASASPAAPQDAADLTGLLAAARVQWSILERIALSSGHEGVAGVSRQESARKQLHGRLVERQAVEQAIRAAFPDPEPEMEVEAEAEAAPVEAETEVETGSTPDSAPESQPEQEAEAQDQA